MEGRGSFEKQRALGRRMGDRIPSPPAPCGCPGWGSMSANGVALFSLLPVTPAVSWFPGLLTRAEGHPREDGGSLACPWFYQSILRAPPPQRDCSWPGWECVRVGGHLLVLSGQKRAGLPSPVVPVVLALTLPSWGGGSQQSQNPTGMKPSGGAVLVQTLQPSTPRVHCWEEDLT